MHRWSVEHQIFAAETLLGLKCKATNGDEQNAADYTEMHVTLGAHFPVFL
jgi:hypothetical protein